MRRTDARTLAGLVMACVATLGAGFESLYLEQRPEGAVRPVLWDAEVPGNCIARCVNYDVFSERIRDMSRVVVASVQLSRVSHPHLAHCGEPEEYAGDDGGSAAACAPWDGAGLYLPSSVADDGSRKSRFLVVSEDMPRPFSSVPVDDMEAAEKEACCGDKHGYIGELPALVSVREMCRAVHASSFESSTALLDTAEVAARKQCIVSVGGHADWTAIGSEANAARLAAMLVKLVRYTFADGLDLNMDHLGEISRFRAVAPGAATPTSDEYTLFALLTKLLREGLDELEANVALNAKTDLFWLEKVYAHSPGSPYYKGNVIHMRRVLAERAGTVEDIEALRLKHPRYEPAGRLVILWTTRLNAFVPKDRPVNYAHAVTAEERSAAAAHWFEADDTEAEEEEVVKQPKAKPSIASAAGAFLRNVMTWFRPKPRADQKRRLSSKVVPAEESLSEVVHGESLEDNEGQRVWPRVKKYVDELLVVAHLQHILNPHPHSEYTSEASQSNPDSSGQGFIRGQHSVVLNLTAVAFNFLKAGNVELSKLRVVLEPHHLLPGSGLFDPLEFNAATMDLKRHGLVQRAAATEGVRIPPLGQQQEHNQRELRKRLLQGSPGARRQHPHGFLALRQVQTYVPTAQMGQRLVPAFVFEWRDFKGVAEEEL